MRPTLKDRYKETWFGRWIENWISNVKPGWRDVEKDEKQQLQFEWAHDCGVPPCRHKGAPACYSACAKRDAGSALGAPFEWQSEQNTRLSQFTGAGRQGAPSNKVKSKRKRLLAVWIWMRVAESSKRLAYCLSSDWLHNNMLHSLTIWFSLAAVISHRSLSSAQLERINNWDPTAWRGEKEKRTTLLKLECRAWFAAAMFNYIPEGSGSFSIVFCCATFPNLPSCSNRPVLLRSIRAQYGNKWEQWLWKRF